MKKTISMLLASALSISAAMPVFAADTFKDVNENSYEWAYEYVEDMAEKGLISGYEDGTFRPGNSVSRMEAFALFARLMGSNNETNAETLQLAKEKYADVLEDYGLSYAEGDVAFMLYRGVISEDELDTYFKGSKKSEAMPRYEAAILITKAMLAEEAATSEVLIDMEYTDVADIPKSARQYVYYVSQKGIMTGMGDGEFSPATSVLRGQIAVMLSKTANSANYFFETAKLESVDTDAKNIKIKDYDSEIGYSDNTKIYKNGNLSDDSALAAGQNVVLTYSEDDSGVTLAFADIMEVEIDETVNAVFTGYASSGGKLTVTVKDPATGRSTTYNCSADATITLNGAVSDINKLREGDYVVLGLSGDTVAEIATIEKSESIKNATLEKIDPTGRITISHEDSEYDGQEYVLGTDAKIYKNGNTSEFSALYRGDALTIKLEYGVVASINATSSVKKVTGVLKSYTISTNPTITIKSDGNEYTYDILSGVAITINGEAAKLADFEIGSSVTLTIESDAVKSVTASSAAGTTASSSLTGVVTSVSTTAKVILISYNEAGSETTAYISCTDNTKYYVIPTLSEYSLKQIKEGDTVVAYGAYQNGIFVSTGVTITPSVK